MLIYDALKQDHQIIRDLLRQLHETNENVASRRRDLVASLREQLVPHTRAEEKVFYDTLKEIDATEDLVLDGYEEHSVAENLLRDLELMDAADRRWYARLNVLKDHLENHLEKEENEVFVAAEAVLAPEEAEMMARAFSTLKADIMQGGFVQDALERVGQYMPIRFARRFQDFSKKLTT